MNGFPAPLRFVIVAVLLWTCGRTAGLVFWPEVVTPAILATPPGTAMRVAAAGPDPKPPVREIALRDREKRLSAPVRAAASSPVSSPAAAEPSAYALPKTLPPRATEETQEPQPSLRPLPPPRSPSSASRWSGDAYVFLRDGSGRALGPGGQLGGSQAFARLSYHLGSGLAVSARYAAALERRRSGEAAVGLAYRPGRLPVTLHAERRMAVGREGRDAFSLFAAGGVDALRLGDFRVDGYAQAGVVGARQRDLFADGAIRAGREVRLGPASLSLGAGAWGGAQPGVSRLDLGPRAALRLPLGAAGLTIAADWRFRVAGSARPSSGPALTIAAGF